MKEVDYIIVGLGIAGLTICEQFETRNKRFIVFDSGEVTSTAVSGGVINPVVLKRFTTAWNAKVHLDTAITFYNKLSTKLDEKIISDISVLRIFASIEEQNDWIVASDKIELDSFLSSEILSSENPQINAPYGLGKVTGAARIYPDRMLQSYKTYLDSTNRLISEAFQYDLIQQESATFVYKGIRTNQFIFTEGSGVIHNPFFPKKLLIPNKGEYLIIKAPKLRLEEILKGPLFVIPLGEDLYKVGATYNREDISMAPTDNAREEIAGKLKSMIHSPFEIINQVSGIRPTTKDRKPVLGAWLNNERMVYFNGLGTRGMSMAPMMARILCEFLEDGTDIPPDIDIKRFE